MKLKITFLLVLTYCFGLSVSRVNAAVDTLTILHVNDTHSCLAPLAPRNIDLSGTQGGIARAASIIGLTKMTETNVLTLHGGDAFIGDLFFNVYFGVAELQLMNALGFDAMTVGNHEFDLTPQTLLTALDSSYMTFPLLSANAIMDSFPALANYVKSYTIKQYGNIKVGIFGITTPETNSFSLPAPVFIDTNIVECVVSMIDTLTSKGCNLIICMSHLGVNNDQQIASNVPGINVIISSHDHLLTTSPIVVTNPMSQPTWIVQADAFYKAIGKMKLVVSSGQVSLLDYQSIPLDNNIPEEPTVKAAVSDLIIGIEATYGPVYTQQIGYATATFDEVAPLFDHAENFDTPLGNLITDAFRGKTGTQIAIQVGGSTSQPIYEGPIVSVDAFRAFGYGFNEVNGLGYRLAKFNITGAALYEGIETVLALTSDVMNDEFLPQVSGMKYSFNLGNPVGQKITSIEIGSAPFDPMAVYSATANEFFVAALSLFNITISDLYVYNDTTEFQVLVDYIINQQTITPGSDGRITEVKKEETSSPSNFNLAQNFPNPFNPSTVISWRSPVSGWQTLKVYDLLGNEVATLVNENLPAGSYEVEFNTKDYQLASEIYFYRIETGSFIQTKKMVLMK